MYDRRKRYLGCSHDKNGPPRLDDRVPASSCFLDFLDLGQGPVHGRSQVIVNTLELLDEADLVTIPAGGMMKLISQSAARW
jgi:hypothetical protein